MGCSENGTLAILPSAARTTATVTDSFNNRGARGIILFFDSTAVTDTPTITPSLQAYDPQTAAWFTVWTAAAAIASAADTTYLLYPGASGGNFTEVDGIPLPAIWRLSIAVLDADSITYSVTGHLLI
jgi:hypothetical protein